jgi:hypothetical protein
MKRALGVAAALVAAGSALAGHASSPGPDPVAGPIRDGCRNDPAAVFTQSAPTWVYVDDASAPAGGPPPPPQWASGTVSGGDNAPYLGAHPTGVDDPSTHLSYDFLINIRPDPDSVRLLGGDPTARTGNYSGGEEETARLHTERESAVLPAFVWPENGDRVTELGSWVWDCGHFDSSGAVRTELHPFRALWVLRTPSPRSPSGENEADLFVSTDATPAGVQADCAHRLKGSGDFKACVHSTPLWQSVNGRYAIEIPAPPKPSPRAHLRIRVVDAGSTPGAPPVAVLGVSSRGASVSVTVGAPNGKRVVVARQIYVGWTPMPAALLPQRLRVTFDSLLVRRAMDPSCPATTPACPAKDETTRLGQISAAPGEWVLYWDVAGIWSRWRPGLLLARDGQVFRGTQSVGFYVPKGRPWRLFMYGRECDFGVLGSFAGQSTPVFPCPHTGELGNVVGDDVPGALVAQFPSPAASVGTHRTNAMLDGSTCPPSNRHGCYQLTYTVSLERR